MFRLSLLSSFLNFKYYRSLKQSKCIVCNILWNSQYFKRNDLILYVKNGKHQSGQSSYIHFSWLLLALAWPLTNSDSNDESENNSTQSANKESIVSPNILDNSTKPPYGSGYDTLIWTLKLAKARAMVSRHEEALDLYHKALEELERRFSQHTKGQLSTGQNSESNAVTIQPSYTQNDQSSTKKPNILESSSAELFIPANLSSYLRARAHIFDEMANVHMSIGSIEEALNLFQQAMRDAAQSGEPVDSNAMLEMSLKTANLFAARTELRSAQDGFRYCVVSACERVLAALPPPASSERASRRSTQEESPDRAVRSAAQLASALRPLAAVPPDLDTDLLGLAGMTADAYAKFLLTEAKIDGQLLRDVQALFECAFHAARLLFGQRHSQVLRLANELAVVLSHAANEDSGALESAERLLLASLDACARERPVAAARLEEARSQAVRRDRANESEALARGHWREWLAERWYRYQQSEGAPLDALDLVIRPHLRAFTAEQRESARLAHLHAVLHANLAHIYLAALESTRAAPEVASSDRSGFETSTSTRSTALELEHSAVESVLEHVRAAAASASNENSQQTEQTSTGREDRNQRAENQQPAASILIPEPSKSMLISGRSELSPDMRKQLQLQARTHCQTAKKLSSRNDDKDLREQIADCLKQSTSSDAK